jgi:signal transduction histidine kinase/DNA-binding response OmpR family regulator
MADGILSASELFHYPNNPEDPFGLHSDYITAIYRDHEGTLWIGGCETGTLYALDRSNGREQFIPFIQDTTPRSSMWRLTRIFEDRNRNLWIGGDTRLDIFDRDEKRFYQYALDPPGQEFQNSLLVNDICDDESGSVWVGTWFHGLFRIVPPVTLSQSGTARGAKTFRYKYDPDLPKDLGDRPVLSLCKPRVDKTAELWLGTYGGGLFGLKVKDPVQEGHSEEFIRYTVSEGLPDNSIWAILEDGLGYLWLATDNGLARFDPGSGDISSYNEINGVPLRKFGWLSGQKGRDGEFTFTCNLGLLVFNPDSMVYNQVIPPVVITDFRLFNKQIPIGEDSPLKKSISETKKLEMSNMENYLSFEFAALNYINPERNRYRYIMEGLDREWINAGYQRQAAYSNLRPGKYTFRVLGCNDDGLWNEEGASLAIIIHPPPWFSWWAYVIYGLIIIMVILWYRKFLISRERLKADLQLKQVEVEKVQELDRMKSRFFASISHEFRTPLTLILGPLEKLISDRPKVKDLDWNIFHTMRRNARKLKGLINQILDLSKLETGQMKLQVSEGDVTGFLKNIILSFLSLAESKNIIYRFKLAETSTLVHFDRDKLDKIACNLITNAFKFTPEGGEISVKLALIPNEKNNTPDFLELSVRDSGIGIPEGQIERIFDRFYQVDDSKVEKQEGTGLGLSLVKELVGLYRGEMKVNSKPGKGSTFMVRLPVSLGSFRDEEIMVKDVQDEAEIPDQFVHIPEAELIDNGTFESGESTDTKGKPILLIVEDTAELIGYIRQCLGPGFLFHEAFNGREGLEKAREQIPDLIVSDIMMPEMNGMEMCESLKRDEKTSHIPIIILTAKGDMESKIGGLQTGADDYLVKPFDSDELRARVYNLIKQRRKLRERYRKEMVLGGDMLGLLPPDENFLTRATEEVLRHVTETDYSVEELADKMGMSRSQLYRKIRAITDQSAIEFIRNTKLKYAASLFDQGYRNIAEVTYQAGFSSPSYFSSCFRKLYGKNPKTYIAK